MRLIAAVDRNWGIGYQDDLQFRIRSDLKRFRQLTVGGIIICGRKTLMSFPAGKPLDQRVNIILSRSTSFVAEDAIICHDMTMAFAKLNELLEQGWRNDQINVIGGADIFDQFLPYCHEALITLVHQEKPADRYLQRIDQMENWVLTQQSPMQSEDAIFYEYRTYRQNRPELWP